MRKLEMMAAALLLPNVLAAQMWLQDQIAQPITLDEAIRAAQLSSPQAAQARGTQRNARVGAQAARLAFLPNVNISASSNWQRGQRIGQQGNLIDFTGPRKSYNDGINLNFELFDGGRRFFDIASARADVDAADAGELASRFQIAQQVKEQYYNVLAARESEVAARAQLAEAEAQMRAATARLEAGAAIRSDTLRSSTLLGNAKLALVSAQTSLANANAALTRLVGSPALVTAAASPPDETLPELDFGSLEAIALEGPIVRQARSEVEAARAARKSARSSYLPTLNAIYSRSGNGFDSRFGFRENFAYSSSFRLSISLPVFNQLTREQASVRAAVAEDLSEANLRDARLRVMQELTQALGLLRNAQQRVEVQQSAVAAAEEDLSIHQQRYNLNASTVLDVLQSQSQLNQARSALISARFDFRVARARLESLLGRDLNTIR